MIRQRDPGEPSASGPSATVHHGTLWASDLVPVHDDAQGCEEGAYAAIVISMKPAREPGYEAFALRLLDANGDPTRYWIGLREHEGADLHVGDKLDVTLVREGHRLTIVRPYFTERFREALAAV